MRRQFYRAFEKRESTKKITFKIVQCDFELKKNTSYEGRWINLVTLAECDRVSVYNTTGVTNNPFNEDDTLCD